MGELKEKIAKFEGEIKTIQNSLDNNETQLKKYKQKKMIWATMKR